MPRGCCPLREIQSPVVGSQTDDRRRRFASPPRWRFHGRHTLLKNDHQTVEKLFKRFEKTGDGALVERRKIVDQIIEELSVHAAIEEQLYYPVTRATVDEVDDVILESLEEHHVVKWLLSELETMDPADERFKAKTTVLMENVRHHVEEEETEFFPKVRAARTQRPQRPRRRHGRGQEVGPTHPHPTAPDTPPGNIVAGTRRGRRPIHRHRERLAQGGVSAAQDLIARFTGRAKPRTSPTGSPTARKTAAKVRSSVSDATDKAARTGKATVTSATKGAKSSAAAAKGASTSTQRTAKAGAKRSTTTATNAAKKTAKTATSEPSARPPRRPTREEHVRHRQAPPADDWPVLRSQTSHGL